MQVEKCCIMMSTYNGEKYLSQQIDSILRQKNVEVELYIRDDGSIDKTNLILKKYSEKYKNVHVIFEDNIGVSGSFFKIAKLAIEREKCDFYAFSDQDDYWLPDKISNAIVNLRQMNSNHIPLLQYTNLKVSDENLNYLYDRFEEGYVENTKSQILAEVCTLGCTCVFNRMLLKEFVGFDFNKNIPHDAWITFQAIFLGRCFYDKNAYILYRQHNNNQSGNVYKGYKMLIQKAKKIIKMPDMKGDYELIAREFLNKYSERLNPKDYNMLNMIANYRLNIAYKLNLLFLLNINSKHLWKEISRRIRILFNKL